MLVGLPLLSTPVWETYSISDQSVEGNIYQIGELNIKKPTEVMYHVSLTPLSVAIKIKCHVYDYFSFNLKAEKELYFVFPKP